MKEFLLKNKGLFAFSDPGAAKAVLAFVYFLQKIGYKNFIIISNRQHSFYKEFNLEVKIIMEKEIQKLISSYKPKYIFTGTSYSSSFELQCLKFTKKKIKVPSFSFVDHWTSINDRFKLKNELVYPDNVLVLDGRAKEIAIKEGVPEKKILIFSNPYLDYLKKWRPLISKEQFFELYNIDIHSSPIIAYLAEPLSNVGGIDKYGTDEYVCLDILCNSLAKVNDRCNTILVKPHPNQDKDKLEEKILNLSSNHYLKIKLIECDINELIYFSDIIVGIFSNALIEASCFKKQVIRILQGLKVKDPFVSMNIGLVAYSVEELVNQIKKFLNEKAHIFEG